MKVRFFARAAVVFLALLMMFLTSAVFAADYYVSPSDTALGNEGNVGGRLGENYNSPAANGGGGAPEGDASRGGASRGGASGGDAGQGAADGAYADTTEDGEVLGIMDTENSATVGIVIAILIAIAVIVLIIALIPREMSE